MVGQYNPHTRGCGVWMWCVDVVSVESGQKVLLIGYKSTDHH